MKKYNDGFTETKWMIVSDRVAEVVDRLCVDFLFVVGGSCFLYQAIKFIALSLGGTWFDQLYKTMRASVTILN